MSTSTSTSPEDPIMSAFTLLTQAKELAASILNALRVVRYSLAAVRVSDHEAYSQLLSALSDASAAFPGSFCLAVHANPFHALTLSTENPLDGRHRPGDWKHPIESGLIRWI